MTSKLKKAEREVDDYQSQIVSAPAAAAAGGSNVFVTPHKRESMRGGANR